MAQPCGLARLRGFFHYFAYNFAKLGLKKLIATCYKSQNADLFSQNDSEHAIYLEYEGDRNNNNVPNPGEIGIKPGITRGWVREDWAAKRHPKWVEAVAAREDESG